MWIEESNRRRRPAHYTLHMNLAGASIRQVTELEYLHLVSTLRRSGVVLQLALVVVCVWNLMAHGDAREGKWRGNWRMEWVASTLHTISERDVSSITNIDARISAASIRLNWRPRRLKWTRPFRRKTKSGFCTCAITFQTDSTSMACCFIMQGNKFTFTLRTTK